jgi:hypothetical protein
MIWTHGYDEDNAARNKSAALTQQQPKSFVVINLTFVVAGNTPGAPGPENYKAAAKRFAETYKALPAGFGHKLILLDSNGGLTPDVATFFDQTPHEVITYRGSGWDIGAHQFAAFNLPADDWIMCFSSWTHFRREGWLRAFVTAREIHGDGLFGSTTSFEKRAHIRGTGFFVRCERMHRYPHGCNSREESFEFEAGPDSITTWCIREGFGAWLVAPQATVTLERSRDLDNIFRRGDQSNIWTFDKHTDAFENADDELRKVLTELSDGLRNAPNPIVGATFDSVQPSTQEENA